MQKRPRRISVQAGRAAEGAAAKKPARRRTVRGAETRARVLDAAERLFAERGYPATSVRDIADAAPAELGSVSYHFASKDDIYAQVLERRAEENASTMEHALEESLAVARGRPAVEQILDAFTSVCLAPFESGNQAAMHYARLVMQRIPVEHDGRLHPAVARFYLPVRMRYIEALVVAAPSIPREDIDWYFALFEASFSSALFSSTQASFAVQRASRAKLKELHRKLVLFYTAGFLQMESLANQSEAAPTPRFDTRDTRS